MNSDAVRILEHPRSEPADLTEMVRQIQAMERARVAQAGAHFKPRLSRPVMLRILAELRNELQAVRRARVNLERLARSRDRRARRSSNPPARPAALFLVHPGGTQ